MFYKRGQIELSFGMIFSVILIVVFVSSAFYAIGVLLGLQKCSQLGLYKDELQKAVDDAWNSPETIAKFRQNLPKKVEKTCFFNSLAPAKGRDRALYDSIRGYKFNLIFFPLKKACSDTMGYNIAHLNISEITKQHNPYCIERVKNISIEKGFSDVSVRVR